MMKVRVLNSDTLDKVNEINLDLATNLNGNYTVGRSPKSSLTLDSPDVSRLHGKFSFQNGNYYYSDLGSINGSLVNDKLAQTNQSYLLQPGDVVRIGEFLLVMEEIREEPEVLPATVFNEDWRVIAKLATPEVADRTSEPVIEVPEIMAQVPEPVIEVVEVIVPDPEPVSEAPELVNSESESLTPAPEELRLGHDSTIIQASEAAEDFEVMAQTPEVMSEDTGAVEAPEVDSQVPADGSEVAELTTIQSELTTIQAPEAVSITSEEVEAPEVDSQVPADGSEVAELTTIQSELTTIQAPEAESEDLETSAQTPEAVSITSEEVEAPEVDSQVPADGSEVAEPTPIPTPAATEELEAIATTPEEFEQLPESDEHAVAEETPIPTPVVAEELEAIATTSEEEVVESSQVTSNTTAEAVSTPPEPVTQASEEAAETEDSELATEEAEDSEEMAQTPDISSKAFEIISKKYIALMAHDSKKPELVQLVTEHKDFLSKCLTIATPSISETLYQQSGLATSQKTPTVPVGGYQAIASLIGTGGVLAVVLLRDFMVAQSSQANEEALLRLCNVNQVLVATNAPTAEAVMHYIKDMVTSL